MDHPDLLYQTLWEIPLVQKGLNRGDGLTVKPVLSSHSKRTQKIGCQDLLSLNAGQKYCRMLSAILLTYIKLPVSIKTFVLSIFKWPLKTGCNVFLFEFDNFMLIPKLLLKIIYCRQSGCCKGTSQELSQEMLYDGYPWIATYILLTSKSKGGNNLGPSLPY